MNRFVHIILAAGVLCFGVACSSSSGSSSNDTSNTLTDAEIPPNITVSGVTNGVLAGDFEAEKDQTIEITLDATASTDNGDESQLVV